MQRAALCPNEDNAVGAAISVRDHNGKFAIHETASSMCPTVDASLTMQSNANGMEWLTSMRQ
jgi:hypothetical protein